MRCNVWQQLAEHVAESLTKVHAVTGWLRQRPYKASEGDQRTVIELEVDKVDPSLTYATAKVIKVTRPRRCCRHRR